MDECISYVRYINGTALAARPLPNRINRDFIPKLHTHHFHSIKMETKTVVINNAGEDTIATVIPVSDDTCPQTGPTVGLGQRAQLGQ